MGQAGAGPTWSPEQAAAAFAHCERAARDHYENFPVASLLLPRPLRPHVAALYAFARQADDYADEAAFEGRRLELLSGWRRALDQAARGTAGHPVFIALGETLRRHPLPLALLHDLLSAFEQDVTVSRYETFDQVLAYCRLSANPVGRLVLHLFGRARPETLERSDTLCTALQLANFWQDIAVDLDKKRCYLPGEEQRRFGVTAAMLEARRLTSPIAALIAFQIDRTRSLFDRARDLPRLTGGRLGIELRLVLAGGRRVLDLIEAAGYDVFTRRPALARRDWALLSARALLGAS